TQTTERQRHAAPEPVALDIDQFQRATTEIAGNAVRVVEATDDAEGGITRLLLSRQNLDRASKDGFRLADEIGAVGGLPGCGSRQNVDVGGPGLIGERSKAPKGRERT